MRSSVPFSQQEPHLWFQKYDMPGNPCRARVLAPIRGFVERKSRIALGSGLAVGLLQEIDRLVLGFTGFLR